ncbi:TetR/AcrR family transcriptional regulator [Pseudolysinimonas kribbensis]|uniref:TetR/AcrR family transcriptional regulator n=1 Tax=Pseudolysinimonas kribbensis TaxID=433641 RepID=UPI0024E0AAFA|nr:TetR/AcrR family transcriptional regulator [Pseudolysinimonas kribbensis]
MTRKPTTPYRGVHDPRTYTQAARAGATEATRRAIIDAIVALAHERLTLEITLDDVARIAGVSVRTVLRHFGTRDRLLDEAVRVTVAAVESERRVAGDGDAFGTIIDHYELRGDFMRRMLAQEDRDPRIAAFTVPGRLLHRRWVEDVFADALEGSEPERRDELVDLLVVATDLQTWALLRRDRGLERDAVEQRMRTLADRVLAGAVRA